MASFCCNRMAQDLAHTCAAHPHRIDCPDAYIAEVRGGFGLMVHDGGSSVIEIAFCPWCGAKLEKIEDLEVDD